MAKAPNSNQDGEEELPEQPKNKTQPDQPEECFVIMPISDQPGYSDGHFSRVYQDIFAPAITQAGFRPVRGDDVKASNLIHLDILERLLKAPIAICDLSSRNPNVLFELGLRQAFDKPVVLVQDESTPPIFDIAPLRFTGYRRGLFYREVLEDQQKISLALTETKSAHDNGVGVNSLVKILSLSKPADFINVEANKDPLLQIVLAELNDLKSSISNIDRANNKITSNRRTDSAVVISNPKLDNYLVLLKNELRNAWNEGNLDMIEEVNRKVMEQKKGVSENLIFLGPQLLYKDLYIKELSDMEELINKYRSEF